MTTTATTPAASTSMRFNTERVILFLLLALALVVRFRYLAQIEHNVDHAYPVWQAMRTLDQGIFPLTGQGTSVLFANPPLTGYLFIPAVALTRSPLGVYVFVIALNTLAVWMIYRAAQSLLGTRLGLVAAGLMAVNPWMIEYSRTSWVQSLLPFFVASVAWLLWPVLMGRARRPVRRTALALVMAALLMQTYLLAYLILVPVALLLLIFRRRVPRRGVLIGGAVIVVTTGLYGVGLLSQLDTVRRDFGDFTAGEPRIKAEAWDAAVRLVTGAEYEVARGLDAPIQDAERRHTLSQVAHYALLGAILLGIAAALVAIRRRGRECDAAIIALLWFGVPVLAMTYTANPVHTTYQLLGVPAGYVLAAWGIGVVLRPDRSRWGSAVLLVASIPLAALMLTNSARYYQETAAIPGAHGLTALPVDYGLELGDAIDRNLLPGQVAYAPIEDWILNSFTGRLFPVIWDARAPALNFVPSAGGVYVSMAVDSPALPVTATRVETIVLPDGNRITVDSLPPAAEVELPGDVLDIPSQQGITLLRYDLAQNGDTWTLMTVWRVDSIAPEVPERIFVPFVHVFNAEGERVLMVNGEGLHGQLWHVGDLHIHRMEFTLPSGEPGPFTLLVGQFDGLHNANVIFLPPGGEPGVVVTIPETIERD